MRRIGCVLFLVMVTLPALSIKPISAQNAAVPKFDAVSVKFCTPGEGAVYRDLAIVLGIQTSPRQASRKLPQRG